MYTTFKGEGIIISDLVGYIICAVLISCMTKLILLVRHRYAHQSWIFTSFN